MSYHPRQPYEAWCSIRLVTCRWTAARFFQRTRPVRMHLDRGAVEGDDFEFDLDYPLSLELFEDSVQYPALGPSVHSGVYGVPIAEALRQSTPLTAVFGDVEDGVEYLEVRDSDVASLHGQMRLYELVVRFC